jgi:hypothetical protein
MLRTLLFLTVEIVLLAGCSGTYQSTVTFDPTEPLRVAVLPFVQINNDGIYAAEESRMFIDNVSLVSKKLGETPVQIVRKQVLAKLRESQLDVLSTALIDTDLLHHGFGKKTGELDLWKLYRTDPKELCMKFLNCEAVLYGRVLRWDRSYYGIESVNTVAIALDLISAKNRKTIFSARGAESERRGLSEGPTGFADLVVEPIKGLDSNIIVDLSRKVVSSMLNALRTEQKVIDSMPPAIFAASHDAPSGRFRNKLIVVMMGTPGLIATFTIGDESREIPMVERSSGNYYGEYIVWPGEELWMAEVRANLSDQYGRKTVKRIPLPPVSLAELH